MDNIQVDTGVKRICINNDPERVITFNPSDVVFAERFYTLIGEFDKKSKEFVTRSKVISTSMKMDENGIPNNMQEVFDLMKEFCAYLREKIDAVFGAGTSQNVFGDAVNLDMFDQFFDGITPFIQQARDEKMKKHQPKNKGRVMK